MLSVCLYLREKMWLNMTHKWLIGVILRMICIIHRAARVSYIQWLEAKRPGEGALHDEMNESRRLYKTALKK